MFPGTHYFNLFLTHNFLHFTIVDERWRFCRLLILKCERGGRLCQEGRCRRTTVPRTHGQRKFRSTSRSYISEKANIVFQSLHLKS